MSLSASSHPGELTLRRLRAGELDAAQSRAAREHAAACVVCRARLQGFDDEQRAFEAEIPFERFAARIGERANRKRASGPFRYVVPALAAAAVALVMVNVGTWGGEAERPNRTKGDGALELRIAQGDDGPQRIASAEGPEPLADGERVRIGYRAGDSRFVLALSIDSEGEVSPLYPEEGHSLPVEHAAEGFAWLPDSVEFYGEGEERVILLLSDEPLPVDAAREAAWRAFSEAKGEVTKMPPLDLPARQFHRTLLKP